MASGGAPRCNEGALEVEMKFVVRIDDHEKTVLVARKNGVFEIELDGRTIAVDCAYLGSPENLSLLIDNQSYLVEAAPVRADEGRYYARVLGRHYDVDVLDELLAAAREADAQPEHAGRHTVTAPMPGLIVDLKVSVGDSVAVGDTIVVMEAMKMQNELVSESAGVVREIHVALQDSVDSQTPLVVIDKE